MSSFSSDTKNHLRLFDPAPDNGCQCHKKPWWQLIKRSTKPRPKCSDCESN